MIPCGVLVMTARLRRPSIHFSAMISLGCCARYSRLPSCAPEERNSALCFLLRSRMNFERSREILTIFFRPILPQTAAPDKLSDENEVYCADYWVSNLHENINDRLDSDYHSSPRWRLLVVVDAKFGRTAGGGSI